MSLLQKHKLCTTKTLQGIEHLHIVINFLQIKQLKLTITLYYPFQDFHYIIVSRFPCQTAQRYRFKHQHTYQQVIRNLLVSCFYIIPLWDFLKRLLYFENDIILSILISRGVPYHHYFINFFWTECDSESEFIS